MREGTLSRHASTQ